LPTPPPPPPQVFVSEFFKPLMRKVMEELPIIAPASSSHTSVAAARPLVEVSGSLEATLGYQVGRLT
jgi:hypothetical protein